MSTMYVKHHGLMSEIPLSDDDGEMEDETLVSFSMNVMYMHYNIIVM